MNPFVAEVRIFPFNFAPKGWAFCNGQILAISQNTALFSLLGTTYGGDGKSTFALPNLQGSVPIHTGASQGPGLSFYALGEQSGAQSVTLLQSEIPAHSHGTPQAAATSGVATPANAAWGSALKGHGSLYGMTAVDSSDKVTMSPSALSAVGGSQPHNNMPPYLALNFCIALQGVFPPRS